jgi:hypothetical protein
MMHLLVHLVEEQKNYVQCIHVGCIMLNIIWTLKGYVRNKTRLKGRMAKGYTIEEALAFFIKYL